MPRTPKIFRVTLPDYAVIRGNQREGVVKVLGYSGVHNYVRVVRKDGVELTVPDGLLQKTTSTVKKSFMKGYKRGS